MFLFLWNRYIQKTFSEKIITENVFYVNSFSNRLLRLPQRRLVLTALDLYAAGEIDFEDALIMAHMERGATRGVYSYDRDFDQVPGVKRH